MRNFINKYKIHIFVSVAFLAIVFLLLLFSQGNQKLPQIIGVSPKNGSENIIVNSYIKITLAKSLSEKNVGKVKIEITPSVEGKQYWLTSKSYAFVPNLFFMPNTRYTVKVLYADQTLTEFIFTTRPDSDQTALEKIAIEQSKEDYEFSESTKKLLTEKPWYTKLPIETDEFVIVYDFDKEAFRIRLKILASSSVEQIEGLKEKALEALAKIGVNMQKTHYYVLFKD